MSARQKFEILEEEQISERKGEYSLLRDLTLMGVDGKFEWPIRIFTPILFGMTLMVNYLLGINRNKEVSDKFSLWVTPPPYFFAIWGLIYTGLIVANIYNLVNNVWNLKTHVYFGITNTLNIIWTIVFDIGTRASVSFAAFILIGLTFFIFMTWVEMGNVPVKNFTIITYVMRNIFAFYLGWCIAATNINFGMDIVYWWRASKFTQMVAFWIMAPLCAIGVFMYNWKKYGKTGILSCFSAVFSVAWAFIGAAITSNKCLSGKC